jgi:hypothetical protein
VAAACQRARARLADVLHLIEPRRHLHRAVVESAVVNVCCNGSGQWWRARHRWPRGRFKHWTGPWHIGPRCIQEDTPSVHLRSGKRMDDPCFVDRWDTSDTSVLHCWKVRIRARPIEPFRTRPDHMGHAARDTLLLARVERTQDERLTRHCVKDKLHWMQICNDERA